MRAVLLVCALLAPAVQAATCSATSGATRNTLVELYTSEGCSSCPPADRWLSQLPREAGLVPLAFHVDYWDRLGWRDPFGQAAFSQRQRARNSGLGWVYTPQVMIDGQDHRNWHRSRTPPVKSDAARARIDLSLAHAPAHLTVQADTHMTDPAHAQQARLYLALFENRLSTRVAAGENARRTLHHDYVVRELAGPLDLAARHVFKLQREWKADDLGVAAFVVGPRGDTLQALAMGACP